MSFMSQMKEALSAELNRQGKTRADLVKSTGMSRTTIDRAFSLDHQSTTDQLDKIAKALGCTFKIHGLTND